MSETFYDRALLVIRTLIAVWLALYVSLRLDLDNPAWAILAVLIVTLQPVVFSGGTPPIGTLLGRGRARLYGTLVGAVMGLVLIAGFSQEPMLYLLAGGLWLSLCSFIVIMLREEHFTYLMMLSGYTATLVSLSAIGSDITHVWTIALARFSETAVGTVTGLLVHLLIAPRFSSHQLPQALSDLLDVSCKEVIILLDGQSRLYDQQRRDRMLKSFQRFESLRRLTRRETRRYRQLMPALKQFGTEALLLATNMNEMRRLIRQLLLSQGGAQLVDILRPIARGQLQQLTDGQWSGPVNPRGITDQLRKELQEHSDLAPEIKALAIPAAQRLDEMLMILRRGQFLRQVFDQPQLMDNLEVDESLQSRSFHSEFQVARYNGLRIFLAFELAGLFWLLSGWQHGHSALLIMGMFIVLFAKGHDPATVVAQVIKGTTGGIFFSALIVHFVMPAVNGMFLLAMALSIPVTLVALLATRPRWSVAALTGTIAMMSLMHLDTSYTLDPQEYVNQALAVFLGTVAARMTFSLLRQQPHAARVEKLMQSGWVELSGLLGGSRLEPRHYLETRMYDRLSQMISLGADEMQVRELLELNTITLAVWRIRRNAARMGSSRQRIERWMRIFSRQLRPGSDRVSPLWLSLAGDARNWAAEVRHKRRGSLLAGEFLVLGELLKTMAELGQAGEGETEAPDHERGLIYAD